ncbi:MAG: 2-oxoisovalerate dehydrogenase [Ignavibacteriota bacterium]
MNEIIFMVEDAIEGGYNAKALGISIFTQADSDEELRVNVREAVDAFYGDEDAPKIIRLHFVREEVLAA